MRGGEQFVLPGDLPEHIAFSMPRPEAAALVGQVLSVICTPADEEVSQIEHFDLPHPYDGYGFRPVAGEIAVVGDTAKTRHDVTIFGSIVLGPALMERMAFLFPAPEVQSGARPRNPKRLAPIVEATFCGLNAKEGRMKALMHRVLPRTNQVKVQIRRVHIKDEGGA